MDISLILSKLGIPDSFFTSGKNDLYMWNRLEGWDDEIQRVIDSFGYSVAVYGEIQYGGVGFDGYYSHAVKFSTNVSLFKPGPGAPRAPTYMYEAMLEIGKRDYKVKFQFRMS